MSQDEMGKSGGSVPSLSDRSIEQVVSHLAMSLGLSADRVSTGLKMDPGNDAGDSLARLMSAGEFAEVHLREIDAPSGRQAAEMTRQGYSLILINEGESIVVFSRGEARQVDCWVLRTVDVNAVSERSQIYPHKAGRMLKKASRILVAKRELECDTMAAGGGHSAEQHEHPTPLRRFISLLDLDRRDISLVILFALVAGLLSLASPLVVESLVNVVSWGTYFQPLLVLASMLLIFLGMSGVLKVLQTWVVEIIQRRQFVRIAGDLAHRFPRAKQSDLFGEYPRELANRVFDIMTIQKATAVLLLDGVSIVLTTLMGLILLAFYHPFLLGFDIVLVITMISLTWVLGRGGITTAIQESKTKYKVAHWLQDVLSMPEAFKFSGGESLAVRRANQLTAGYVTARKRQFAVVIRQVIFAVSLQVIASTTVLGLGGWLVLSGQLTLGQLVASELVVTVVVSAFAKAGKSLEKFYDLMAGIDKVGHLLDITADPKTVIKDLPDAPANVSWGALAFVRETFGVSVPAGEAASGSSMAIVGDDHDGKSELARAIAGLSKPTKGMVQIEGVESLRVGISGSSDIVGYVGQPQVFHGTIHENVDLGRAHIPGHRVREVIEKVGLADVTMGLAKGLETKLQTGGHPLSQEQIYQLMFARAILMNPRVLVIDGVMDLLSSNVRETLWKTLGAEDAPWTLFVVTHREDIAEICSGKFGVHRNG